MGPDSVGEIRSNRFGTYSRTERNCILKLSPPNGYGIILTVLKIDFRNRENCKDFIKVSTFKILKILSRLFNVRNNDQKTNNYTMKEREKN